MANAMSIPLDMDTISHHVRSPFHREIATRILAVTRSLAEGLMRVEFCQGSPAYDQIRITPANKLSAEVEVQLLLADPEEVAFGAGKAASLSIPTDLYGPAFDEAVAFLGDAISAVLDGRFEETLYLRGATITRCVFELRFKDRPVFTFSRTNAPDTIATLAKRRKKEVIAYQPYSSTQANSSKTS